MMIKYICIKDVEIYEDKFKIDDVYELCDLEIYSFKNSIVGKVAIIKDINYFKPLAEFREERLNKILN